MKSSFKNLLTTILFLFINNSYGQSLWNLEITTSLIVCVRGDTTISTLYSILETDSLKYDMIYGCAAKLLAIYQGATVKDYILEKLKFWENREDSNFSWYKYYEYQRIKGFLGEESAISGMDTVINYSNNTSLRKSAIWYLTEIGNYSYYDSVKSFFLNQASSSEGISLLGEYGKDNRYRSEVRMLLSNVIEDSIDELKIYLAALSLSKFDSLSAVELLDNRFRNSDGAFRRNLFKYLELLDPQNQMQRSMWVIPEEPDENLRSEYIPLIYNGNNYDGPKEYLSPIWIKFIKGWLLNETSKLIKVQIYWNLKGFLPSKPNTSVATFDLMNDLINLEDTVYTYTWLGDLQFKNELQSILQTAKTNLLAGDSLACAIQVKSFQDTVDFVYKDSLNTDPRFVTLEGWKFLYWNAQYILDRLPKPPLIVNADIEEINPAMSLVNPGSFTIEVKGTGFTTNSIVYFNGNARATTFVADTLLTAEIQSTDVSAAGNYPVWVSDGTINSDTLTFRVVTTLPKPVRPVLECVRNNGDGTYTAFFGYKNDNDVSVYVPIGSQNKISPAPWDRGQPGIFKTGRRERVFSVNFRSGNIIWHLINQTAKASRNSAPCN